MPTSKEFQAALDLIGRGFDDAALALAEAEFFGKPAEKNALDDATRQGADDTMANKEVCRERNIPPEPGSGSTIRPRPQARPNRPDTGKVGDVRPIKGAN